jgi:adenylate cyclase
VIGPAQILQAAILIVDDLEANVLLLEEMLGAAGYVAVSSTRDPRLVGGLHREHHYDLILLDLQMPIMDGFKVMEELKEVEKDGYLPVLVVTAQPAHKLRALQAGARDFVSKPFDLAEVLTRVRNMLEVRLYARALQETVRALEASREEVRAKNVELHRLFDEVVAERKVSERLALHVPPHSIAARLPARPDVTADSCPEVTVVIADVVGFAELAPAASAGQLALVIDEVFGVFDGLASEHGLRKIKTLGNSYMAAAGVPEPLADHAPRAARLSLAMLQSLERFNERTGSALQVRVGIATGPAVAGVIGRSQYVYDLWGDAANTASRMESHGVAGRVQVSERTRLLLEAPFLLEERGVIEVDGSGELRTWFLSAP